MEFFVNREVILPALNRVIGIVERRKTLPILGNLAVVAAGNHILLTASDMDIEIKTRCMAEVAELGGTTVPARKLYDICRSLGEGTEIRLKITNDRCTLTAGRSRFILGTLPVQDYPHLETGSAEWRLSLPEQTIRRMIEKTAFAMAQQDVRYYLNGLLWDLRDGVLVAVATDGHRLAKYVAALETAPGQSGQAILPYKAVLELKRLLKGQATPAEIALTERYLQVVTAELTMTAKLIDGRFPDYERVIPPIAEQPALAQVEPLRHALSRAAILTNDKYRAVLLTFTPGLLKITATNPEQEEAEEEVEIDYAGESTAIGFNVAYLLDVLNALDTETVAIQIQDANSPSLWRGQGCEHETYVIMPMRL